MPLMPSAPDETTTVREPAALDVVTGGAEVVATAGSLVEPAVDVDLIVVEFKLMVLFW